MATHRVADFQVRAFLGLADPDSVLRGAASRTGVETAMPRCVNSACTASFAGESESRLCSRFNASKAGVDKYAVSSGATSLICEVLGCTLIETALTCPELFDK